MIKQNKKRKSTEETIKSIKPKANSLKRSMMSVKLTNYQYQKLKRDIITDAIDIEKITKKYYEQLYYISL